ncbi:hypothetical protein Zmor_000894 [Zophobas morio]|uniref:Protein-cysteine N-palmitoyltransferase Rasp n=1 Tax=Zophobas morio TaxID=2755281 RepID=A0AA38J5S5_9CUCU|nr:hypothetical protein Zmor_000894 [Zophobas morio]
MHLRRDISQSEFVIYVLIWVTCVFFSIYCFATSANKYFQNYEDHYSDFTEGWSLISRRKDNGDPEWRLMKLLLKTVPLWIIFSCFVSEVLRQFKLFQLLQVWQILISTTFIITELGILPLGLIVFQPLLFALVLFFTRSRFIIWVTNILTLLLLFMCRHIGFSEEFLAENKLNQESAHVIVTTIYWMNLKCVSYCIDFIDSKQEHISLTFASYCLHMPNLVLGPFVSYKNFEGCYKTDECLWDRFLKLILNIFRFLFWFVFTDFFLHFIYVNAVVYHYEWIKTLGSWSLYGYGYTMGQFFHIKYVIMYGLSTTFQKFENIEVPSLPICIGRVHLYSDMWRYFDAGLYNFLQSYMYIPLMKNFFKYRLIPSLICFTFIYVWHGTDESILVWSVLNYVGIVIEQVSKWIDDEYLKKSTLEIMVGPKWRRRITCAAASPLLAMSCVSNFYFFSGNKVGYIFVSRLLNYDILWSNLILLVILYTMCQISTEIKSKEKRSSQIHKKN